MSYTFTAAAATAIVLACVPAANAQSIGFVEDFNNDPIGYGGAGFAGFEASGGVGGADDGYMLISRPIVANFGAFASGTSDIVGDYVAAGVTGVSFFLN